ncbi:MAG: haloacid dehalogenase type II [Actinomycetota bacterium]|nr:haloacid dehalogenase type II [Actinomycetota bacterium]
MSERRITAVVVDVVETLFSLDAVEEALDQAGAGAHARGRLFAALLRDGFALAASGTFRPFADVADAALAQVAPHLHDDARRQVLSAFGHLEPHADAGPALEHLAAAGVQVAALTNGSSDTTSALLRRSGLEHLVHRVISVQEVGRWKPAAAPYQHAAAVLGVDPPRAAMVAVHAWDIHGARRAGLVTGWAARLEGSFPPVFGEPDIVGPDLVSVVDGLLALQAG